MLLLSILFCIYTSGLVDSQGIFYEIPVTEKWEKLGFPDQVLTYLYLITMPHPHPLWTELRNAHPILSSPLLLSGPARPKAVSRIQGCSKAHEDRDPWNKRAFPTQVLSAACRQGRRYSSLGSFTKRGEMFFSDTVLMSPFGYKVQVTMMPHIKDMLY